MLREETEIAAVLLIPRAPQEEAVLELRRDAANLPAADRAEAAQTLGRVQAPRAVAELLPAVALLVEDEGMKIDLAAAAITKDEAGRESRLDALVVVKADLRQGRPRASEGLAGNGQVEVGVWARFLADEGIEAPAAVEDGLDVRGLEAREDLQDVLGLQRLPAGGGPSSSIR